MLVLFDFQHLVDAKPEMRRSSINVAYPENLVNGLLDQSILVDDMNFQMPSYQTKKFLLNIKSGYCSSWSDSSLKCTPQRLFPIELEHFILSHRI